MQIVVIRRVVKIVAFKRFNFHKEKLFMQVPGKTSPKIRSGSVTFLIAILLFLLPFVNIKCNNQKFASNTGIGLAFGINYKTTSQLKSDKGDRNLSISEKQSGKMYVAALIALLLGIAGFVLTVLNPGYNKINTMIAVLGALALIVLLIQIKYDVKDKSGHDITDGLTANLKVAVEFTVWYYLSLVSFIAASFLSYRQNTS
jgi:hypothetical protein